MLEHDVLLLLLVVVLHELVLCGLHELVLWVLYGLQVVHGVGVGVA